jgi:hypothetical protein
MSSERISVTYLIEETVDLPAFIPVFHGWVREQSLPDLLVDVANYLHVPAGPGLLVVGHEGDYGLEVNVAGTYFRYTRKRGWAGGALRERVTQVWQVAQAGAVKLAQENGVGFVPQVVEVALLDRLVYPNTAVTFHTIAPELRTLFGGEVRWLEGDARQPLTVQISSANVTLPTAVVVG